MLGLTLGSFAGTMIGRSMIAAVAKAPFGWKNFLTVCAPAACMGLGIGSVLGFVNHKSSVQTERLAVNCAAASGTLATLSIGLAAPRSLRMFGVVQLAAAAAVGLAAYGVGNTMDQSEDTLARQDSSSRFAVADADLAQPLQVPAFLRSLVGKKEKTV